MSKKRGFAEIIVDRTPSLKSKRSRCSKENHLYGLPDDLIMYMIKIYIQNKINSQLSVFDTNTDNSQLSIFDTKSLLISSYIQGFMSISKHLSEIIKCNIEKFFKPKDYFFCNYMFAQVITKDVFFSAYELGTDCHIVIKNETFLNKISIPEYVKYLNGEPEELQLPDFDSTMHTMNVDELNEWGKK